MTEHEGHRQRMKQRFLHHGLDNFDDHNVLELLLFYAQPRQDTNLIAHHLLDAFGSLNGVFSASPEELMTVSGVKENAATLIRLVGEAARRYLVAREDMDAVLSNVEKAGEYLIPRYMHCRNETVYLVCLDVTYRVIDCCRMGEGGLDSAQLNLRQIVQTALMKNAKYAILSHNHTSGIALPSLEDKAATRRVRDALAVIDVQLVDHIIVAGTDFVSLADDGLLD